MREVDHDARTIWQVVVMVAVPDAQVAMVGCGGVHGEVGNSAARLVEIRRIIFDDFDLVLALPWSGRIGNEPQPRVRREIGRAERCCVCESQPRDPCRRLRTVGIPELHRASSSWAIQQRRYTDSDSRGPTVAPAAISPATS